MDYRFLPVVILWVVSITYLLFFWRPKKGGKKGKLYITHNQIHKDLRKQAHVIRKDFDPQVIIAIGGGGYGPARTVRTWIDARIYGVSIQLYDENDKIHPDGPKVIQWLDKPALEYIKGKRVLIIDEVDDTRTTLSFCVKKLKRDGVEEIAVLVLHNKLKPKPDLEITDYFACNEVKGDTWIVYPWEADIIDDHEEAAKE